MAVSIVGKEAAKIKNYNQLFNKNLLKEVLKMKKIVITGLAVMCLFSLAFAEEIKPEAKKEVKPETKSGTVAKTFVVYSDKQSPDNHYIPSGWMGDVGDIKLNDQYLEKPHTGTTSLQFVYSAKKSGGKGWAGVYWQNPANNWGTKKGGYDLTGINKITFWARGEKGGEVIQKFVVGGIKGTYSDSATIEMGPVELTDAWKQYTINITGKDLSYISGVLAG